ncbi:hypothetical protein BDN70DRAFT_865461 [Pholiota conissans]|uniref:Uncharacterized protein n=1 Tax=Pholiota conissans TaxID=109636 RepID=A0A9P5YUT2_9AGAR|nr:hypothetical protein BDN70DRAFT_865461 [Pholiota conissans]
MDALSTEWRRSVQYFAGDRVAFKLGDSLGVAAFECLQTRENQASDSSQPVANGNAYWKHYPRGFPRKC